jgi:hypothetical protein
MEYVYLVIENIPDGKSRVLAVFDDVVNATNLKDEHVNGNANVLEYRINNEYFSIPAQVMG